MKIVLGLIGVLIVGAALFLIFGEGNTGDTATSVPESNDMETNSPDATMDNEALNDTPAAANDASEADMPERTIALDGFNYGYSQEEIRVEEGTRVTIELSSTGGFHDWVVDEFNAATEQIPEGETTSVTFVADEAGEYEFYCSVGNHREQGMVGTLIVE